MIRQIGSILFLCNVLIVAQDRIGVPKFHFYSPKEYNGGTQIWSAAQDREGVMYFASGGHDAGVLQFDGQTWRKITLDGQRSVFSIATDDSGTVWVGSLSEWGFLKPDASGSMQYHSLSKAWGDSAKKIRHVWRTVVFNNEVFFGALDGVIRYAQGKAHWIRPKRTFHYMLPATRSLWIKDRDEGLMRWDTARTAFVAVPGGDFFKSIILVAMVDFERHAYWVITANDGIYTYNDSTGLIKKLKTNMPLENLKISNAVRMKNGEIIVTSTLQGIFVMDSTGRIRMHADNRDARGLSDTKFAFHAADGSVWFGHNNGLSVSDFYSPITFIRNEKGIDGAVTGVMRFGGKIVAGTTQGLWESVSDEILPELLTFRKIKGTDFSVYGMDTMFTRLIIYGGDFAILDTNRKVLFQTLEIGPRAIAKLPSRHNTILAAHRNILYAVDVFSFSMKPIHTFDDEVTAIVLDRSDQDGACYYWMSLRNQGVVYVRVDKNAILHIMAAHTMKGLNAYSNLSVLDNQTYILNGEEVYRLTIDAESKVIRSNLDAMFTSVRGGVDINHILLRNKEFWIVKGYRFYKLIPLAADRWQLDSTISIPGDPIYIDPQDSVTWFAGTEGVARWDHRVTRDYALRFPVLIRRIILNNDSLLRSGSISGAAIFPESFEISYAFNSLTLYFSASHYHDISALRFSWKMEGFTDEWTDWSEESRAIYTNLNEGEYTFRVRAKNIYGVIGEEASYHFRILPPWYRTWWFRVIVLSVIAFILWRVYLYRVHRLLAVERLRVKIASDLHDDIGSNLSKIAMYSELVQETDDPKETKPMLKAIGDLSRNVISSMSDIVWSIDARNDRVTDLNLRMQNFAHDLLGRKNITVKFESTGMDEAITLPVLVKQNVYLI
ncbi:hypothetical protein HUU58_16095, partial [bacterium]|nr:hypothetical protein [bacterium]